MGTPRCMAPEQLAWDKLGPGASECCLTDLGAGYCSAISCL
jgi:hypothetical protein